jgi:hypothetical protein
VEDIVGLYLDPPDKALVLAVDEKSQIIERDMLRVSDEPLQVRVETFNSLMFEFLSKYGSPGIQERLGKLLNKD